MIDLSIWTESPPMTLPRVSCNEKPMTAVSTADVVMRPAIEKPARRPTMMNATITSAPVMRSMRMRGNNRPTRGRATRNVMVVMIEMNASVRNARPTTSAIVVWYPLTSRIAPTPVVKMCATVKSPAVRRFPFSTAGALRTTTRSTMNAATRTSVQACQT